jgi:hypothetical protein
VYFFIIVKYIHIKDKDEMYVCILIVITKEKKVQYSVDPKKKNKQEDCYWASVGPAWKAHPIEYAGPGRLRQQLIPSVSSSERRRLAFSVAVASSSRIEVSAGAGVVRRPPTRQKALQHIYTRSVMMMSN